MYLNFTSYKTICIILNTVLFFSYEFFSSGRVNISGMQRLVVDFCLFAGNFKEATFFLIFPLPLRFQSPYCDGGLGFGLFWHELAQIKDAAGVGGRLIDVKNRRLMMCAAGGAAAAAT